MFRSMIIAVAASAAFLGFGGLAMAAAPPGIEDRAGLTVVLFDDVLQADMLNGDLATNPGLGISIERPPIAALDDWVQPTKVADVPDCTVTPLVDPLIRTDAGGLPSRDLLTCRTMRGSPPQ